MSQDLKPYIESERAKGMSDDAIKTVLYNLGYEKEAIAAAFQEESVTQPAAPVFHAAPDPVKAAAVPSTPAFTAPASESLLPPHEDKKKKTFVRAGIIAAVVILLGAAGAGAYVYLGAARPTPAQGMTTMLMKMSQVHSFNYRLNLKTDIQAAGHAADTIVGVGNGTYTLDLSGVADYPNTLQSTATIGVTMPELQGSATVEFRMLNGTLFVRLTDMSQLGIAAALLGPFQGQWVSFDLSSASSTASQFGVQAPAIDAAKLAEIKGAIFDNFPLVITGELPDGDVESIPAYHYGFRLDKDRLIALQLRLATILGEQVSETDLRRAAAQSFDATSEMKGEIWIGKKDMLLHKVTFGGPYRMTAEGSTTPIVAGTSSATLILGGFDQPVTVSPPSGAKSIQEMLTGFLGAFSGSTAAPTSTNIAPGPPPRVLPLTVSLTTVPSGNPVRLTVGDKFDLNWNSDYATHCSSDGTGANLDLGFFPGSDLWPSANRASSGSRGGVRLKNAGSTTYTLTCSREEANGQTTSKTAAVTVIAAPAAQ